MAKECTIIYTAEITEVVKNDELDGIPFDESQLAAWIESKLNVDDVRIKSLKFFSNED